MPASWASGILERCHDDGGDFERVSSHSIVSGEFQCRAQNLALEQWSLNLQVEARTVTTYDRAPSRGISDGALTSAAQNVTRIWPRNFDVA